MEFSERGETNAKLSPLTLGSNTEWIEWLDIFIKGRWFENFNHCAKLKNIKEGSDECLPSSPRGGTSEFSGEETLLQHFPGLKAFAGGSEQAFAPKAKFQEVGLPGHPTHRIEIVKPKTTHIPMLLKTEEPQGNLIYVE